MRISWILSGVRAVLGCGLALLLASVGRCELEVFATTVGINEQTPYTYARVEVRNKYGRDMTYRLVIRDYFSSQQTTYSNQSLGAGQTRVHHVPLLRSQWRNWHVETIDDLGKRSFSSLDGVQSLHFLHVSSLKVRLTSVELEEFGNHYRTGSGPAYSTSYSHAPSYSGSMDSYVSQVESAALPDNWLCYSPFKAVVIEEQSWQGATPAARKALTQWVQAGGRLMIYGGSEPPRTQRNMFGQIEYVAANPLQGDPGSRNWNTQTPAWLNTARASQYDLLDVPYAIRKWTGSIGGLTLATLFFVVAGPLNYMYFARRNRIRALLISLPVASIACCLLITGYFLVSQGFAKRGGSVAVIVLDEETDSAITFSRHVFFSGLYPLGGFVFPHSSAFCPLGQLDEQTPFTVELSQQQRLRSGFFSPSTNFHYFTVAPWMTRAKLVWNLEEMTVLNGFDADAAHIVVRVGDKTYEARQVARGSKGQLTECPNAPRSPTGLAERALDRGTAAESYLLRRMDAFLAPFPEEPDVVRYTIAFDQPPVDLNAGLTIGGGNACCLLVGKSVLSARRGE